MKDAYWFDGLFNADDINRIFPSRKTTTIEEVCSWQTVEDKRNNQPQTITEVLRKQDEVNRAF